MADKPENVVELHPEEKKEGEEKEPEKVKCEGITVVSPMYGDRSITDRMVLSVITQFISEKDPFKIHLVLVDDYIEKRGENDESYYSYYTSEDFKQFYDPEKIRITIIKNKKHEYQGHSREIGFLAGDYKFFVLVDCDDMLAPNCCDRYLHIIRDQTVDAKPISCIHGMLYSFDTGGYEHIIYGNNIWVQGRCYNRDFLVKNGIHFPTGMNSKCGEDYPFIRKLDYAIAHDDSYQCISFDFQNQQQPVQCTAYWFPNYESLSRKDPHYGQHLSGWTMQSSNAILDFFEEYNEKYGYSDQEDEFMKHEYLNMTVYSFYNLLDFIKEVAATDYDPAEEDWYALRDNVRRLRTRLYDKYYKEIVYSDIEDMLFNVHHNSDVRFVESWIGTFYDYMKEEHPLLTMTYKEMRDYAATLEFDGAMHEVHAPYVQAWSARHPQPEKEEKTEEKK